MLEIRVGGLAADLDGRPVPLPADARARELLGWLVVAPGPHARSALAGRLRPDVGEESARKTLRDAVYELRRVLGPDGRDAIVATRDQVGLDAGARARRPVGVPAPGGRGRAGGGRRRRGSASCSPGWTPTGCSRPRRARRGAGRACSPARRAGRGRGRLRRRGPLDAPAAGGRAARGGRPSRPDPPARPRRRPPGGADGGDGAGRPPAPRARRAALARDPRARRGRAPRAGVDAGARARRARRRCRRHWCGRPRRRAAGGARPARGRLERGPGGDARFALVAGEPGIGKTTVAGELARRVHAAGAAVLYGRCVEQALVPFQPWVEALEGLLGELPPEEAEHWLTVHDGALARLLPARGGEGAPSTARPPATSPSSRSAGCSSTRPPRARAAGARRPPLDRRRLRGAAAPSHRLARCAARLLVLVLARAARAGRRAAEALAELRRAGPLCTRSLTGLDDEAVAALLARRWRRRRPRRRGTASAPAATRSSSRSCCSTSGSAGRRDGPARRGRDVVDRRLARLPGITRDVLALAADRRPALRPGRPRGGGRLARRRRCSTRSTRPSRRGSSSRGGRRFAFAHALVAEAIASALPASGARGCTSSWPTRSRRRAPPRPGSSPRTCRRPGRWRRPIA